MQEYKLLVLTPEGDKRVVSVLASGGYYDENAVIHDERKDGPLKQVDIDAYETLVASEELAKEDLFAERSILFNSALEKLEQLGLSQEELAVLLQGVPQNSATPQEVSRFSLISEFIAKWFK